MLRALIEVMVLLITISVAAEANGLIIIACGLLGVKEGRLLHQTQTHNLTALA